MPISLPHSTGGPRPGTFVVRVRLLTLAVLCLTGAGAVLGGALRATSADRPVRLVERLGRIEAWPAVSLLFEASETLSIDDVRGSLDRFEVPRSPYTTLGVRTDPVWLHIPFEVDAGSSGHWILDIDHPPLELVDVYLLAEDRVESSSRSPSAATGHSRTGPFVAGRTRCRSSCSQGRGTT